MVKYFFKTSADRYIFERILEAYSELTGKNITEVLALLVMDWLKHKATSCPNQLWFCPLSYFIHREM